MKTIYSIDDDIQYMKNRIKILDIAIRSNPTRAAKKARTFLQTKLHILNLKRLQNANF